MADLRTSIRRHLLLPCLLAAACGATATPRQPVRPQPVAPPQPEGELYAVEEALRDALSGPWHHLGTGSWPGNNRMYACAYRNERVLVVDAYCSIKETQAFRIDVYSPRRGRVRVYAEANGPVSMRRRSDYFTFKAESEPVPGPAARLPTLSLSMSFEQLYAYEEQRYGAYLPGCFGGTEHGRSQSGCLGPFAARGQAWSLRNAAFLERANGDWERLVSEARALAQRHGRDPL